MFFKLLGLGYTFSICPTHTIPSTLSHTSQTLYICVKLTEGKNFLLLLLLIQIHFSQLLVFSWMLLNEFPAIECLTFYCVDSVKIFDLYSQLLQSHHHTPDFFYFLCLTKLPLQNLITFSLSNPWIHFYILLLLGMMLWKLIYIATAGVKAGK